MIRELIANYRTKHSRPLKAQIKTLEQLLENANKRNEQMKADMKENIKAVKDLSDTTNALLIAMCLEQGKIVVNEFDPKSLNDKYNVSAVKDGKTVTITAEKK